MSEAKPATTSPGDERDRLHAAIMNIPCHPYRDGPGFVIGYRMGHRDARHAAAELVFFSTVQQVGADALDAARYRRLKEWFASANFFPEEMDLDPGVALIFVAPVGLKVSADLDATIDGAPKSSQGDQQ